jgi:hypothetical protein
MGEAVFAQLDPLPTNLEGYQRFWAAQRSRDPGSEPVAPTGASLLGDPITLAEAQSSSRLAATAAPSVPPLPASAPVEGSPPEKALTPEELNRQRLQPLLAEGAAAHARRQAQQPKLSNTVLPVCFIDNAHGSCSYSGLPSLLPACNFPSC